MIKCIKKILKTHKENINEENADVLCEFNGIGRDCDLVKELREKQNKLKDVQKELNKLETDNPELIKTFLKFLDSCNKNGFFEILERCGHFALGNNWHVSEIVRKYGMNSVQDGLQDITVEEIDKMCNELKIVKEKGKIIKEYKDEENLLKKNIDDIKSKLGIE